LAWCAGRPPACRRTEWSSRCESDARARRRAARLAVHRHKEAVITAIVAAVLFAIALLLHLANLSLGPLDFTFFELAGLIAAALHLAGIGTSYRHRARR
jgi:cation transport ATPase